ncbi:MAG: hypothetical protein QXI16_05415 [Sulfolobaceae archaeon]
MIIDAILDILLSIVVGFFELIPFPDVPQGLDNFKSLYLGLVQTYIMPIINFLFGHTTAAFLAVTVLTIFNIYIDMKIIMWIYDKVRGSGSD